MTKKRQCFAAIPGTRILYFSTQFKSWWSSFLLLRTITLDREKRIQSVTLHKETGFFSFLFFINKCLWIIFFSLSDCPWNQQLAWQPQRQLGLYWAKDSLWVKGGLLYNLQTDRPGGKEEWLYERVRWHHATARGVWERDPCILFNP